MTSYSLTRAITLPLPRVVMAKWEIEVIFEPTGDYGGLLSNPSCPERILNEYSASTDVKLRSAVARNPNLSLSIFEVLSKDKSLKVKRSLSENLSCPINLLKKLSLEDPIVYLTEKSFEEERLQGLSSSEKLFISELKRLTEVN